MLEITQNIDKYIMRERLGQSSTAEVWKAFDSTLQRPVVIKFLRLAQQNHSDTLHRLQQDFRILVSLNHPNIVQIYDTSSPTPTSDQLEGGSTYVVMPYIGNMTLANYSMQAIKGRKVPSVLGIAQLFMAVGSALDYAHQRGVVHGNLKPTNILLNPQNTAFLMGEPILTDFNLISLEDVADEAVSENEIRASFYSAPEQILNGVITEQCDIYALGIMLYELCTGKHPFQLREEASEPFSVTTIFEPIPPSQVNKTIPPALEAVILQSIAREPEERFADISTMVLALMQALNIPLSSSIFMEYHIPFLELLQKRDEEGRDKVLVSELIDVHQLFAQEEGLEEEQNEQNEYHTEQIPVIESKDRETDGSQRQVSDKVVTKKRVGKEYKSFAFVGRLHDYKFIPLSIIPLLFIASTLLWSLGVGQVSSSYKQRTKGATSGPLAGVPSGTVRFRSSNQGTPANGEGINDEVDVNLIHINPPQPGKSYYIWLQADANNSDNFAVLLGTLNVVQGSEHLIYQDPQHADLLVHLSRFLITEEDAKIQPTNPSPDSTTWRVAGAIAQTPNPNDQKRYGVLDHIRHLLASDTELESFQLKGGLSIWFMRTMQHVQELAQKAGENFKAKDDVGVRAQLIRLLSNIDGAQALTTDLPSDVSPLNDGVFAQVGLLSIYSYPGPLSYLTHIGSHMSGLQSSPGVTADQKKIASTVQFAINIVNGLLREVHDAIIPLIKLSPDQLLQTSTEQQLNTITSLITDAYRGKGNTPGTIWITAQLAQLAVITLYKN